ncbi:MAG: hypothetical protein M3457_20440 [Chloroflexota bacterium]|nr:hypothetical protein [Chloroflexota bacterium]
MTFRLNEKTAHQGTVQPMLPISQSLRGSGLDLKLLFEHTPEYRRQLIAGQAWTRGHGCNAY